MKDEFRKILLQVSEKGVEKYKKLFFYKYICKYKKKNKILNTNSIKFST